MTCIELQGNVCDTLLFADRLFYKAWIVSKILASSAPEERGKLTYFQNLEAEQSTEQRETIGAMR